MRDRALLWTAAVGVLCGSLVGACVSFDLDSRRFRCDDDPATCGEGRTCGPDGFCVEGSLADASPGDATSDGAAPDADTGGEDCGNGEDDDGDDLVDCEDDDCDNAPCGIGCVCSGGEAAETACGDHEDNDGDGLVDCNDETDCPATCSSPLLCCPDGCGTSC